MAASIAVDDQQCVDLLRLSITGACNLNCFYCRPLDRARDFVDPKIKIQPSDVTKLVKIAGEQGVKRIWLDGGEPLLRKDAANFVKSAMAHKGIQDVRLVTNGTFLKAYADTLKKFGLRKVDINFDSMSFLKYQRITGSDCLYRVLDGIEKVEKLHYTSIRLNILLLDGINNDEIVNFARLTKDHRIHIRFLEYHPCLRTHDPYAQRGNTLSVLQAKRLIDSYQQLMRDYDVDIDDTVPTFRFHDGAGKVSFLSKMEIEAERAVPKAVFTCEGVLINEAQPKRALNILEDLRKNPKDVKLHRAIRKIIGVGAAKSSHGVQPQVEAATSAKVKALKSEKVKGQTGARSVTGGSARPQGRRAASARA